MVITRSIHFRLHIDRSVLWDYIILTQLLLNKYSINETSFLVLMYNDLWVDWIKFIFVIVLVLVYKLKLGYCASEYVSPTPFHAAEIVTHSLTQLLLWHCLDEQWSEKRNKNKAVRSKDCLIIHSADRLYRKGG